MDKRMQRVIVDTVFVVLSVIFAVTIQKTGAVDMLLIWLGELKFLGVFIAGMLFTSIFTTATSIVLLANLAETVPLYILAPLGGLGAVLGDYLLFRFLRDTILDDVKYLLSFTRLQRSGRILKTRLCRFCLPLFGAIILASPLPDELGIALFSMSGVNKRLFLTFSYVFNSIGIFLIGLTGLAIA